MTKDLIVAAKPLVFGILLNVELIEGCEKTASSSLCEHRFFGVVSGQTVGECMGKLLAASAADLLGQPEVSLHRFEGGQTPTGGFIDHFYFKGPLRDLFGPGDEDPYRRPSLRASYRLVPPPFDGT